MDEPSQPLSTRFFTDAERFCDMPASRGWGKRRARMLRALSERLRRLADDAERDVAPHSRVSVAHFRREAHTVVRPEADLSEWVHRRMVSDWDSVRRGRNSH